MKIRKVERPDSTTIWIEFPFHVVKDHTEMKNIFDAYGGPEKFQEAIVFSQNMVGAESFQPEVAVLVKHYNLPSAKSDWRTGQTLGYIYRLELSEDVKAKESA